MLRLFRSIRHSLVNSSGIRKYLLYALGEILLVMIGILLALEVNTWNQEQSMRKAESKLLRELQKDLEVTLDELAGDMRFLQGNIDSGGVTIERIRTGQEFKPEYQMAFDRLLAYSPIWPRSVAYENMKAGEIDLIQNDSIRNLLTEIYSQRIPRVKAVESTLAQHLSAVGSELNRFLTVGGYRNNGEYILSPASFQDCRNNKIILNSMIRLHNFRHFMLYIYTWLKESVEELYGQIQRELKVQKNLQD